MTRRALCLMVAVVVLPASCSSADDSSNPSGADAGEGSDAAAADASSGSRSSSGSSSGSGSGSRSSSGSSSGVRSDAGSGSSSGSGSSAGSSSGSGSGFGSGSSSGSASSSSSGTASCADSGAGVIACGTNPLTQTFNAGLTYYSQTSANNCAMPWPSDGMYTALSTNLYDTPAGSSACGKCVQIKGQTLLVVDQCPASTNAPCTTYHLDLSPTAYTAVQGSTNPGSVANSPGIPVKFVPCPVTGNIQYSFATSTQIYYLAMIILNAKYGIQKIAYRASGTCNWTPMTGRTDADAHWIINSSVPNPIDFQVTDEWGHVLEDDNLHWAAGQTVPGRGQFPTCP